VSDGAVPPPIPDRDRVINAMMSLVAEQGWRRLSISAIAAEAGVPLLQLYREFSGKPAILGAFFRRIDEEVLAVPVEPEPDERPRDRVFDLLMRRFDALRPYRPALEVLGRELPADPLVVLGSGARLLHSMAWMLEAGGIATGGFGGIIAVKLTAAAYLATFRGWLRDESSDLATTMAALDRRLRRIERWYGSHRPSEPRSAEAIA
jgi:AcrR family transcriptional regulator